MAMKTITYNLINSFDLCYDPIKYIPKDYSATLVEFINDESVPYPERIWLVMRTDFMSERLMRLFAVWCYRRTLKFVKNPDPRSLAGADVAEKFANGEATNEELLFARNDAISAAWSAESTLKHSARNPEEYAAGRVKWTTAWFSAEAAAASTAESSRNSAIWSANHTVCALAHDAGRDVEAIVLHEHLEKLIEMIKTENI